MKIRRLKGLMMRRGDEGREGEVGGFICRLVNKRRLSLAVGQLTLWTSEERERERATYLLGCHSCWE